MINNKESLIKHFYSILPSSALGTKVSKDIIDVVLEYIGDNFQEIYSSNTIYEYNNIMINEELLKIYLSDLYNVFYKSRLNQSINFEIDRIMMSLGYSTDELNELRNRKLLGDIVNKEYLTSSKDYKQKKGTKYSIEYVYNMVKSSGLQPIGTNVLIDDLILEEAEEEFSFKLIEGSIYPKLYNSIVVYAAHPVGFLYRYVRILRGDFVDYFSMNLTYNNINTKVIYIIDGVTYEDLYTDKTIIDIQKDNDYVLITFSDGSYLFQYGLSDIKYYDEQDNILATYPNNATLTNEFELSAASYIHDDIEWTIDTQQCDKVNPAQYGYDKVVGQLHDYTLHNGTDVWTKDWVIGEFPKNMDTTQTDLYNTVPHGLTLYSIEAGIAGAECAGYGLICGDSNFYLEKPCEYTRERITPYELMHPAIDYINAYIDEYDVTINSYMSEILDNVDIEYEYQSCDLQNLANGYNLLIGIRYDQTFKYNTSYFYYDNLRIGEYPVGISEADALTYSNSLHDLTIPGNIVGTTIQCGGYGVICGDFLFDGERCGATPMSPLPIGVEKLYSMIDAIEVTLVA